MDAAGEHSMSVVVQIPVGVWLSPVEHRVRDAGVAGSNPATPTSLQDGGGQLRPPRPNIIRPCNKLWKQLLQGRFYWCPFGAHIGHKFA